MRTRGVDFGKLTDDEYLHVVEIDDYVVYPLSKATTEVEEVRRYVEELSVDNATQKGYVRNQVEDLIFQLKQILDNLED